MSKLDEIEAKSLNEWVFGDDVVLLIRAVRQYGRERKAYQALFEAVDNDYQLIRNSHPEIYDAYDVITATPEPEEDVMALLEEA